MREYKKSFLFVGTDHIFHIMQICILKCSLVPAFVILISVVLGKSYVLAKIFRKIGKKNAEKMVGDTFLQKCFNSIYFCIYI